MKAHNKYKNVLSRLDYLLINTGAHRLKDLRFGLRTASSCLKAQQKYIEKLEAQLES